MGNTSAQARATRIESFITARYPTLVTEPANRTRVVVELFADLIQYARLHDHDPLALFTQGLSSAAEEVAGLNSTEHIAYHSTSIAPVDGIARPKTEKTQMEVAIVRHEEIRTKTPLRTIVPGLREQTDVIHDLIHLGHDTVGRAALELWDRLESLPDDWLCGRYESKSAAAPDA